MQKKVTYGLESALNDSHDDFHEDRHASTIRLLSRAVGEAGCPYRDPSLRQPRKSWQENETARLGILQRAASDHLQLHTQNCSEGDIPASIISDAVHSNFLSHPL